MTATHHYPDKPILEPLDALRTSKPYVDFDGTPELIETHISHLFLTDRRAYKLKKPLDLGFLDYSSKEKRRAACEAELKINRRLAPNVYLDVLPVGRGGDGNWTIGEDADPSDWLVVMQRLPEDRCFQTMIETGRWDEGDIQAIIDMLSLFYQSLSPIHDFDYLGSVTRNVDENRPALEDPEHVRDSQIVRRVGAAQRQFLFLHAGLLQKRQRTGKVVEGHGDLRAEHIYMTDPPVVIDGIEFSRELRLIDVADELCFFAVTCEILDAPEIGERVLWGVLGEMQDQPSRKLLHYYHTYRACVRAKVETLRSEQMVGHPVKAATARAERYLQTADEHARHFHRRFVVIVRGLSGTGKTTLATALSEQTGAVHLSTDQVRRRTSNEDQASDYSKSARSEVYNEMIGEAKQHLANHESVILDATFLNRDWMNMAAELERKPMVFTCVCPDEVARQRIARRRSEGNTNSDANESVFAKQRGAIEAPPASLSSIEIDTTTNQHAQLERIRQAILTVT